MDFVSDRRRAIKDINTDFDLFWNADSASFIVTHRGYHFQTIPYNNFTRETLQNIRRTMWLNENGNFTEYIDKHNDALKARRDKQIEDMAYNLAKDIRKPLIKDALGA